MKKCFLIIGLLMIFIPIIMDIYFIINSVETDAIITNISSFENREGYTYYTIYVMFEANGQTYSGTLTYGTIENINVNDTQTIVYNLHNPNQFTNNNNIDAGIKSIIAMFGFFMVLFSIIASNPKEKRKNKTFRELNNIKAAIRIFVISTIFLIFSVMIIYKNYRLASTIYFLSLFVCMFSVLFMIEPFIVIYSFLKIKNDEIYPILINDKYDKKFINNIIEVFFTPTCIVDTSRILKKINYLDIALIDMNKPKSKWRNRSGILIVDKNLKFHKIAVSFSPQKKIQSEIFNELEKRVPNVLVGYSVENLNKIKNNKI